MVRAIREGASAILGVNRRVSPGKRPVKGGAAYVEGGGEGSSLIAVNKWVILRKALPKCGGFLDHVLVVAGLRPVQGGLQSARRRSDAAMTWGWLITPVLLDHVVDCFVNERLKLTSLAFRQAFQFFECLWIYLRGPLHACHR
jgi:hypothetical protein